MKRLLSTKQRTNFDVRSSNLKFEHLLTNLAKLIGVSITIAGIFAPAQMAKAALQAKSNNSHIPLDVGKEAYSFLALAIADYTGANFILNDAEISTPESTPLSSVPISVIANQPIPETLTDSLIAKSDPDSSTTKLEFEPLQEFSNISGSIKPIFLQRQGTRQTLAQNVLTTIKPLELLALENKLFKNQSNSQISDNQILDNKKLRTISSQLIENLESGIEAIVSGNKLPSTLAPELPSLIAKVYLPETSDYGISNGFVWPAQGLLTSKFGWRWGRLHQGVDIAAPVGKPIWAAGNGTIDFAGWNSGGYGNMVDILHPNGTISRYAHLSAIYVKRGQPVNQSQVIAAMGNTGNSTGPHLHFEIRPNGRTAINPLTFLAGIISKG